MLIVFQRKILENHVKAGQVIQKFIGNKAEYDTDGQRADKTDAQQHPERILQAFLAAALLAGLFQRTGDFFTAYIFTH